MKDSDKPKQTRDEKGRITGGHPPNGLDKNPENRHSGAWKKEDTLRYKIEQTAKMDDSELAAIVDDDTQPRLVRNFAGAVQRSQWREIKEIIEMIYGKPKESVDLTSNGGSVGFPTVRIIDERPTDTK